MTSRDRTEPTAAELRETEHAIRCVTLPHRKLRPRVRGYRTRSASRTKSARACLASGPTATERRRIRIDTTNLETGSAAA